MFFWKTKSRLLQEEIEFLRSVVRELMGHTGAPLPTEYVRASENSVPWVPNLEDQPKLHTSDQEADLDYMLQDGIIDKDEWAAKMDDLTAQDE